MVRLATIIIFIVIVYSIFRYVIRMFRQEMYRKSEGGSERHSGGNSSRNHGYANTEEDYRQILEVTTGDTPATIRKKYKELLAKYHPDKVQHLGIEFQEIAERKTREIMEAYEFFRKKYNL